MSGEGFARALSKMVKGTRFGSFKGAQPVPAGVIISPGVPSPASSPDPGDLNLEGPGATLSFGPNIGTSSFDADMSGAEGWVYVYETTYGAGVIPPVGTPGWPGADSFSVLATEGVMAGSVGLRLTLWQADSGPGGAHDITYTPGAGWAGAGIVFVGARMLAGASYCGELPQPADFVFQTLADQDPGVPIVPGPSGVNDDTSAGWAWVRLGVQRHAMDVPLSVASGSGAGGAPTIDPASLSDPSVATLIVLFVASDHAPVVAPEETTPTAYGYVSDLAKTQFALGVFTGSTAAAWSGGFPSVAHAHLADIFGIDPFA
jgi:hypothetical protein